jgi:subtilase family serine protease
MHVGSSRWAPGVALAAAAVTAALLTWAFAGAGRGASETPKLPLPHPLVTDYQQISKSEIPPTQAQCASAGRRCFSPQAIRASYNVNPLYGLGIDGHGITIAIVDSFGSDTMAHDLHVFDTQFGVAPLCGEEGVIGDACTSDMGTFSELSLQGSPATKAPPSTSKSPGQEDKSAWALEVALDVETAHAMAPGANILLVHTPTAETLGVQGFPQMMAAEQYVVDHHLAQVITQSFGAAEESFHNSNSLQNLRHAFESARDNGVTVLASSGDFGTLNTYKAPVSKGGTPVPDASVTWPSSDPLVTSVGGTSLCTDPNNTTSRVVDSTDPPTECQGPFAGQAEVTWDRPTVGVATGGGFSHVFARPDYQGTLPAGSTDIPADQRGVPDIALQANSRTGALVYLTLPPDGNSGTICPGGNPCSTGWYDIGGTSLSSPQWAGIVALAAQAKGHGLGQINPALYTLASDPTTYANDFFDVTVGSNHVDGDFGSFNASTGWDPNTGLGTPNVANLVPDLANASP